MAKTVITGVDGNFGSFVANSIMKKMSKDDLIFTSPNKNVLKSYSERGVVTRYANFNDPEHLVEAFAGGETLLLISLPFVGEKRRKLHKNAVDAAKAAGIKKIIYTSIVGAGDPENEALVKVDHEYTENYIKEIGGMEYIFLRNSQYTEAMISAFEQAANSGVLANNMGNGKMAYISRDDCAEAAACVAAGAGEPNTIYYITGPELLSISEFVKIGSEVTGRKVNYVFISDDDMYKSFDEMGVPRTTEGDFSKAAFPFCSDDMVSFGKAIREGKMSTFTDDFQKLTGKTQLTVREIFENIENHRIGDRHAIE
ncbi:NmrA family NAD(P)-binding protein [Thermoanaerobacterium thermosaccharolyticum]|uniref:NmrA family NAD(P)-binding protein n=1 Tax=Thermoanaerobacterium thermosaccharolyticum TaxID=1517 RepID=UPI003DA9BB40